MGSRGALVIDISALVLIIIVVVAMIRQKKFALQMTFLLIVCGVTACSCVLDIFSNRIIFGALGIDTGVRGIVIVVSDVMKVVSYIPFTFYLFCDDKGNLLLKPIGTVMLGAISVMNLISTLFMSLGQTRIAYLLLFFNFWLSAVMLIYLSTEDMVIPEILLSVSIPSLAAVSEVLAGSLHVMNMAGAAAAINLYMNYHLRIERELLASELALSESRVKLLVSQIQPHFIFNSLYSIKALCRKDPEKAADLVTSFSKYLRVNLDSISSEKMIPFEQELSHIEKYVELELANPGLKAEVKYDLAVTDFMLPVLSIEPLVENAIRHGVASRPEGGTVTISSFEDEDNFYVVVEDNGKGIENITEKQKDRKSIGMENVKTRLDAMCHGHIEVKSDSSGTRVQVFIPKKIEEREV